jgi:crossover junction endodeoxyribonuclease RuvC
MRILGIDPGLRFTGYGCIDTRPGQTTTVVEGGVIRVPPKPPLETRLLYLHEELESLIEDLRPEVMAIETLFTHPKRASTGVRLGHARGVILLAAASFGAEVIELTPAEVKKAITGDGQADKARMQLAVAAQCGLATIPEPSDVADALGIAICAARRLESTAIRNVV